MTRPVPDCAVQFIKGVEACKLTTYPDSAGVPTDGYGHTGPEVAMGSTISQETADADLAHDLGVAAGRLEARATTTAITNLSDHQYGALISFVFNLGADPTWTIWKVLNAGQFDQVPDQMKRFDKARVNGVLTTIPGLDHRRLAEVTLWNTADVAASVAVAMAAPIAPPPSSQTRDADTPPTPVVVKPLIVSKSFIASAVTASVASVSAVAPAIQAASEGVKQVSGALTPYADAAPQIAAAIHYLAIGSAGLAVATVALLWLKHRQAVVA